MKMQWKVLIVAMILLLNLSGSADATIYSTDEYLNANLCVLETSCISHPSPAGSCAPDNATIQVLLGVNAVETRAPAIDVAPAPIARWQEGAPLNIYLSDYLTSETSIFTVDHANGAPAAAPVPEPSTLLLLGGGLIGLGLSYRRKHR